MTARFAARCPREVRCIGSDRRRWVEEYRYDALGRRVWTSTTTSCWPTNELVCLTNGVRRTIWDGNARLAEIQAPIDPLNAAAEELDQNFPVLPSQSLPAPHANGDPNPFFGRVVYAPGLAVDQPLSVTRYEYKDSPPGSPLVGVWPSPLTITPFWDYRGTAIFGLFTDGTAVKPLQLSQGQKACPNPGEATADRCVLLQWSFSNNAYNQAFAGIPNPSWFGRSAALGLYITGGYASLGRGLLSLRAGHARPPPTGAPFSSENSVAPRHASVVKSKLRNGRIAGETESRLAVCRLLRDLTGKTNRSQHE